MRRLSLLLLVVLLASGCGTLTRGTTQEVAVDSSPQGAEVVVQGQVVGVTPAVLRLSRKSPPLISLRLDGYEPETVWVRRKLDLAPLALNVLTTYGAGLLLDLSSGGAYSLEPSVLAVRLQPVDSTSTAPDANEAEAPVPAGPRRQNGPRFGVTFLAPGVVDAINQTVGEERIETPYTTQFGWQLEFQTFQTETGLTGVVEAVPLIGGLERGLVLPTVSLLAGARTPDGLEFGVGPTLTLTGLKIDSYNGNDSVIEIIGTSLALVGGKSFDLGGAHVPVNGALVLGGGGVRLSLLVGLTTTSGRY